MGLYSYPCKLILLAGTCCRFNHLCTWSNTTFCMSSEAVTTLIFSNRNWLTLWNVKKAVQVVPIDPEVSCIISWVKSWLRALALSLTAGGNKKKKKKKELYLHLKSAWVSSLHTGHASVVWKITGYHPFPISPVPDQTVAGSWNNYPKGCRSNLVYSSLSTYSSDLALVITTSLSPPKSSPKVLLQSSCLWLCYLTFDHWSKQTQHQYARASLE